MQFTTLLVATFISMQTWAMPGIPTLECEITYISGDFSTFKRPEIGETVRLPLADVTSINQNGRIAFSRGGYIPLNEMEDFNRTQIIPAWHSSGGWRAEAVSKPGVQQPRTVTIDVIYNAHAPELSAWIKSEFPPPGLVIGMALLKCKRI